MYEGWSRSGQVLYDDQMSPQENRKAAIYSISNKLMIQFNHSKASVLRGLNNMVYWNVSTVT